MNTKTYQKCQPKIIVSNHRSNSRVVSGSDTEDNKSKSRERCDSYEFDLHQLYHNAVECLINADYTIKSLRRQSTSKDEQIAMLEEKDEQIAMLEGKIVQMSLELASSKALQDEHTQQLHRMKRRISSAGLEDDDDVGDGDDGERAPHRQSSKNVQPSLMIDDSPVSVAHAPEVNSSGNHGIARQNNTSRRKRRQCLLTASLNDSATARTLANIGHFFHNLNNRNNDTTTTTTTQQDDMTKHIIEEVSSQNDTTIAQDDDMMKNPRHEAVTTTAQCSTTKDTKKEVSISKGEINFEGRKGDLKTTCRRRQSFNSLISIEGVLFPVSSEVTLDVCFGGESKTSIDFDHCTTRIGSDCANEEWPEFR